MVKLMVRIRITPALYLLSERAYQVLDWGREQELLEVVGAHRSRQVERCHAALRAPRADVRHTTYTHGFAPPIVCMCVGGVCGGDGE